MSKRKLRTPAEAKADFANKGISISTWAAQNGFNSNLVINVLSGRCACLRGQSHQIAVKLGIKEGEIASPQDVTRTAMAA